MKRQMLEDFIKYAKSEFGYEINVKKSSFPDSFESIFGGSFLNLDSDIFFECNEIEDKMTYRNSNSEICISTDFGSIAEEYYPIQEFELAA